MPYIDVKLTKNITVSEKNELKAQLGEAICLFPGKSENWLMCNIETGKEMWFRGDNSTDIAFVEVKIFGDVNKSASEKFTAKICDYFNEKFSIASENVYIRYEGGTDWGWNGTNF